MAHRCWRLRRPTLFFQRAGEPEKSAGGQRPGNLQGHSVSPRVLGTWGSYRKRQGILLTFISLIYVAPSGLDDAHHIGEEGLMVQMLLSSGNILTDTTTKSDYVGYP